MRRLGIFSIRSLVWVYRQCIRPMIWAVNGGQGCCRYTPTCSQFMLEAVEIHGPWKGFYLGVRRILRCHPWGGHGYDPVPPKPSIPKPEISLESSTSSKKNTE